MDKILHVASTFKSHENDDGSVMIRGMASTDHSDRAGDVIAAEAWTKGGLENFKNNPVILFNHDYDKPIGRATGVNVTKNGLELEAKISKSAPAAVCELVKDGVLGAFSVGFKVKDADYLKETDGLMIKDAELFEVSVVSVPCNQAATFSLAKSFDSIDEYEEFKKTFTNRVDLPGQSLTSKDSIESNVVSDAPKHVEKSTNKETKMSEESKTPEIDLEAFAKKVADETAAKIAMKQAEQKAAEEAEAKAQAEAAEQKAAQEEQVKSTIRTGIETGAEKLMADVEAKLAEKDASLEETLNTYRKELTEKQEEIEAMRKSKMAFEDRKASGDLTKFGKEFLQARILGAITRKGYDTKFAQDLLEKAGAVGATGYAGKLDQITSTQFVEEVSYNQQVAGLFDELAVSSGATVLPIARTPAGAEWGTGGSDGTSLQVGTEAGYEITNTVINAYRLLAGTYILNDTDEQLVISLIPQLTKQLAKAHAIALDKAILFGGHGGSASLGLVGKNGAQDIGNDANNLSLAPSVTAADADGFATAEEIGTVRKSMAQYGQNTNDLAIIVGSDQYYNMIHTTGFTDISEVGSDLATKVTGEVGSIFGIKVVSSDLISARAANGLAGVMVNTSNFVIPRLAGVSIETEYSVVNQRTELVATQSLGFEQLVSDSKSAVTVKYGAS